MESHPPGSLAFVACFRWPLDRGEELKGRMTKGDPP